MNKKSILGIFSFILLLFFTINNPALAENTEVKAETEVTTETKANTDTSAKAATEVNAEADVKTKNEVKNEPVKVVFITDDKYVTYMRTSIRSIIANKKPETNIIIYVLGHNLSDKNIKKIQNEKRENVDIQLISIPDSLLQEINHNKAESNPYVSRVDNAKFFITSLLNNVDKVIYLDGDTITRKDLSKLYFTDLGDNYIGAVDDWQTGWEDDPDKRYFNNGVMLLDLAKMRENNVEAQLIDYKLNDTVNRFVTQDAYNTVMYGRTLFLPLIYDTFAPEYDNAKCLLENIQKTLKSNYDPALYPYKTASEFRKDVAIIHYCGYGNKKPWYGISVRRKSSDIWYKYAPADFWKECAQGKCKCPYKVRRFRKYK